MDLLDVEISSNRYRPNLRGADDGMTDKMTFGQLLDIVTTFRNQCIKSSDVDWELTVALTHFLRKLNQLRNQRE